MTATATIFVVVPVRIQSTANLREHWSARARRNKLHRETARLSLQKCKKPEAEKLRVTLTRVGARKLDPDNLAGGFKALQDGVADWLGIDDGSDRIEWKYEQRTKTGTFFAEVLIEWELEPCAA